jgi:hypothetical protein
MFGVHKHELSGSDMSIKQFVAFALVLGFSIACSRVDPFGPTRSYHVTGTVRPPVDSLVVNDAQVSVYRTQIPGTAPIATAAVRPTGAYDLSFTESCRALAKFVVVATATGFRDEPAYIECGQESATVDFALMRN